MNRSIDAICDDLGQAADEVGVVNLLHANTCAQIAKLEEHRLALLQRAQAATNRIVALRAELLGPA